jgi:hypothetical protein
MSVPPTIIVFVHIININTVAFRISNSGQELKKIWKLVVVTFCMN